MVQTLSYALVTKVYKPLEKGWHTQPCADNGEDAACLELPYVEPVCLTRLRQWAVSSRSRRTAAPCEGATWYWKKYWDDFRLILGESLVNGSKIVEVSE